MNQSAERSAERIEAEPGDTTRLIGTSELLKPLFTKAEGALTNYVNEDTDESLGTCLTPGNNSIYRRHYFRC